MALVPAGCFSMGSTDEQIEYYLTLLDRRGLYQDEQPAHPQCFSEPFWIDVYEVTNGFYGSDGWWQGNDQPRESVSWLEADAYCRARSGRLPTEAEWEHAASGPENRVYPWGNEYDCTRGNFHDSTEEGSTPDYLVPGLGGCDGFAFTSPINAFPSGSSWVGALDMAGSVWDWVADWGISFYPSGL